MSPLKTEEADPKAAHWNRAFNLPPKFNVGETIQNYFRVFSPTPARKEWCLERSERLKDRVNAAFELFGPAPPIFISIRRAEHAMDHVEFDTEAFYGFGPFYNDGLSGMPFSRLLRDFFGEQLRHNMSQRAFQNMLTQRFGKCDRDAYGLHGHEDFRAAHTKMRQSLQGTVFENLNYLIGEGVDAIASHLIDAVLGGDGEKANILGRLLELYALGLPIVEMFHGKLLILEA